MLKVLKINKNAFFISIALAVAIIAVNVETEPLKIAFIVIGALLGTLLLDLDYIIHAYFVEPQTPQSGLIKDFLLHKDYGGLSEFIHSHKAEITGKTLNSSLFQVVLAGAVLFVLSSTAAIVVKALILSAFVNSIYRFMEEFLHDRAGEWFWSLRISIKPLNMYLYLLALLAVLVYGIKMF